MTINSKSKKWNFSITFTLNSPESNESVYLASHLISHLIPSVWTQKIHLYAMPPSSSTSRDSSIESVEKILSLDSPNVHLYTISNEEILNSEKHQSRSNFQNYSMALKESNVVIFCNDKASMIRDLKFLQLITWPITSSSDETQNDFPILLNLRNSFLNQDEIEECFPHHLVLSGGCGFSLVKNIKTQRIQSLITNQPVLFIERLSKEKRRALRLFDYFESIGFYILCRRNIKVLQWSMLVFFNCLGLLNTLTGDRTLSESLSSRPFRILFGEILSELMEAHDTASNEIFKRPVDISCFSIFSTEWFLFLLILPDFCFHYICLTLDWWGFPNWNQCMRFSTLMQEDCSNGLKTSLHGDLEDMFSLLKSKQSSFKLPIFQDLIQIFHSLESKQSKANFISSKVLYQSLKHHKKHNLKRQIQFLTKCIGGCLLLFLLSIWWGGVRFY